MAKRKLTILEAVDNLSHLAELDVEKKEETSWLDPSQVDSNEEKIKETFLAINEYLKHLYQKERAELKDPHTQQGLKAMMQLAGEAIDKMEKFTEVFKDRLSHDKVIPEYQQLQQFYLSKIVTRKEKQEEKWEGEGAEEIDLEKQALKDLESVRRDHEYELFYIRKEDGMAFFHHNLLRHIRLVGNFDETLLPKEMEDPYEKMKLMLDKDLHTAAKEILEEGRPLIEEFFKEAMKFKGMNFIGSMNKALMALMLAANPRHLSSNIEEKRCVDYFVDFQIYLREAMRSEEYQRILASVEKVEPFLRFAVKVIHGLSMLIFVRHEKRAEIVTLIDKFSKETEFPSIWAFLIAQDEALRAQLRKYPSGPLMQILETFRHEEEKFGFDPLVQHNLPSQLFALSTEEIDVTFLHLPCPVHQEFIDKPLIVEEFKGFLRNLGNKKFLLINLQNRTSWQEHSRSVLIEQLQKEAEFVDQLEVVTLATNTDFYHQLGDYTQLTETKDFIDQFKEQILNGEQCGFYFPPHVKIEKYLDSLLKLVHEKFFEGRETLSRKQRLDFIEILYVFLILKVIGEVKPDLASLSCKDGIDTGAAFAALLFGAARLLGDESPWSDEDKAFFQTTLEGPALLLRHRPIDSQRLHRALSALDHYEVILRHSGESSQSIHSKELKSIKVRQVA